MKRFYSALDHLMPLALLVLFGYFGVNSAVHGDAFGALLGGVAVGLMLAAVLIGAARRELRRRL